MRQQVRHLLVTGAVAVTLLATGAAGIATTGGPHRPTGSAAVSASVPPRLLGHVVTRIPTTRHVVALTFDGGANADGVRSVLATLHDRGVPASFFLTGDFARRYPTRSVRLAAAGRLGDHTVSHPHLTTLSSTEVRAQVAGARQTIIQVTGEDPKPFFRFPFGEYDGRTLGVVNGMGYVAVGWTVDSLGWTGTAGGNDVRAVVHRVVAARTPGEIVLMHLGSNPDDHSTLDADALPRVIHRLREHGYSFVTVAAMLR